MLLISVGLGVIFAIFAAHNTNPVTLNFAGHLITNIPLYIAILVPLIIGLSFAMLVNFIKSVSQSITINKQKHKIKNLNNEVAEVTKDAHKFQLENTKIKAENGEPEDEDSL